jgi:hypothetical protein
MNLISLVTKIVSLIVVMMCVAIFAFFIDPILKVVGVIVMIGINIIGLIGTYIEEKIVSVRNG